MQIGVGRDSFIMKSGGVGVVRRNKHMVCKETITAYSFVKISCFVSI